MNNRGPKCPNHGCPLEGLLFPLKTKGTGTCPVSGCQFDYEAELDTTTNKVDKDGNVVKSFVWRISGGSD